MAYPSFNSGDVLNASDMNAVGLWLVKSGTLTTATNTEITSAFSADYRNYRLAFHLTALSAGSAVVQLRMGTTAGTDYYTVAWGVDQLGNGASTIVNAGAQMNILDMANGFNIGGAFTVDILGPQVAVRTSVNGTFTSSDGAGFAAGFIGGILNNTTAYTSFSLLVSTGTFSGVYRLYGYKD